MAVDPKTVYITSSTWTRDSNGLFDYESTHLSKKHLKTSTNAKIIRIKNDIHLINEYINENEMSENSKILALLTKEKGKYMLSKPLENEENEGLWMVVKQDPESYELMKDDVIKFGKVMFNVKETNININNFSDLQENPLNFTFQNLGIEPKTPQNKWKSYYKIAKISYSDAVCRICYDGCEENEDDYLISPCQCLGSLKYIHMSCLRYWMKNRAIITQQSYGSCYIWKSLECELCHMQFPDVLKTEKEEIPIIDYEKPSKIGGFMVLEYIPKNNNSVRMFHILDFNKKNHISIGRDNESDLKINDISVSRFHSILSYDHGSFYLSDNNSKFGTLALLNRELELELNKEICIQIGKTVLNLNVKNPPLTLKTPKRKLNTLNNSVDNYNIKKKGGIDERDSEIQRNNKKEKKDLSFLNFIALSKKIKNGNSINLIQNFFKMSLENMKNP